MMKSITGKIVTVSSQVDAWAGMAYPVTNSIGTHTGKRGSSLMIILPVQSLI
jgi:hypothetical protein